MRGFNSVRLVSATGVGFGLGSVRYGFIDTCSENFPSSHAFICTEKLRLWLAEKNGAGPYDPVAATESAAEEGIESL